MPDGAAICLRENLILGKNEILEPSSAANMNQKLDLSLSLSFFCPPHGKLVYHAIDFRQGYLRYCDGHIKAQGVIVSASISILQLDQAHRLSSRSKA